MSNPFRVVNSDAYVPSIVLGTDVSDTTCMQNVYYAKEGPVEREEPKLLRGVDTVRPCSWVHAEAPAVEYTFRPSEWMPQAPQRSRADLTRQHRADVRVRRALRDAWCDPARARKDLVAAATIYDSLKDEQGLASAFIAHAQTRLGDANLAMSFAKVRSEVTIPSSSLAREEYSHAHAIFTSLLNTQTKRYDVRRLGSFEEASTNQFFRPRPLQHTAADTMAAAMGG
jgi:hypothetical protein